jgi:hypothetical protein
MEKEKLLHPFTDSEILELEERHYPTPLWQKAFNVYNSTHTKRLSMGCRPCFNKVMVYLLKIRFNQG